MALIMRGGETKEGALPSPKEALPNPNRGNVYVVLVPSYFNGDHKVVAVFKTAHALEHYFRGAMLAQIRYQGRPCRIEEARSWYIVIEKPVEG